MNAFFKVESRRADLVVRVPLDLLRGVPFPVKDSLYDVTASGPATQLALLFLEDGFVVLENGVRVAPSSSTGRLAPASNRSFDSFESAARFADTPPDASTAIVYDKGSLDVHFTYAIGSPQSILKIQTQVAADLGSGAMMTVRYLAAGESSRALIIRSGDESVALNPAWYHAASGFIIVLSSVVAIAGGYWMLERWQALREVEWPRLDATALVGVAVWTVIVPTIFAVAVFLMRRIKVRYRLRALHGATRAEATP